MVLGTTRDLETGTSIKEIEEEMSVREIMSKIVITIDSAANAFEVAKEMMEKNVGSIIITKENEAVGIITERDMVKKIIAEDKKPNRVSASDIMSSPLITTKPSTNVIEASRKMIKCNIRRLAVMEGTDIVGIITDRDLLTTAPGLNTILAYLIEMNRKTGMESEEELEGGICQRCGNYVSDLMMANGMYLCENCRDEEGYYE